MNKIKQFTLFAILLFTASAMAQFKPTIGFDELMISAEKDFQQVLEARKLAETFDLPHTIYLPEGVFIEAKGIENNQVVYTIINDLLHPFNQGEVAFWGEVDARFDLSEARVHWSGKPTQNPELGYNITEPENMAVSFIMVLESTNDAVMTFNYNTGALINTAFIPGGNPNLSTPIKPLLTPNATILVSDQLTDNIVEFDTLGSFIRILYGGNTTILDNCRGISLRPPNTSVVAAIASSANQDAIAEFDVNTGTYVGNFIAPNAAQLDGPWEIIFRTSDCLVSGEASDNIARYDLSGNYLGLFASINNFPEQIYETSNGNIIVANFGGTTNGLVVLNSTGTQVNNFTNVTGLRGCIQLGSGNYLITNGTGVYVIDQNTGALLSTPVSGVSARSASNYDLSIVPVELTSFSANVVDRSVVLNWTTATEINNQGFEIEKSADGISFNNIGFVPGFGTTTEPKSYSYTDQSVDNGTNYYRLKQIDFDGSFTYSSTAEVEMSLPIMFSLEQNYPNPFNPSTSIQFSLPVDAQVKINVYNLVGENVAEIVSGNFAAGTHKVNFDAASMTSGIYFYQIDATGNDGKTFSSVRKMTLLK
jgi:hypothetical protein